MGQYKHDEWLEAPLRRRYEKEERMNQAIENLDNYDGWRQWMEEDEIKAMHFEAYCSEHFWNILGEEFKALLHPAAADKPKESLWEEWRVFLWLALDERRLEIMLSAFVRSNRDEFEEWALKQTAE